jgi:hypothetical protein
MAATAQLKKQMFECGHCRNKTDVSQVLIPYAAKLLLQELQAMNIATRLITTVRSPSSPPSTPFASLLGSAFVERERC